MHTRSKATSAPTLPVDKLVLLSLPGAGLGVFAGVAPRTMTVVGSGTPDTGVGVRSVMEGSRTYIRTPAIGPGGVMVMSVDKPQTISTGQQIAPLSFGGLPGGDVPGENEPSKAEGRMDGGPVVKGVAFSM